MKQKIYVIIVTYNGMQWIEKCLKSIHSKYNIVVIDNKSTDNTVSFIQANYPDVHIIKQTQNLGFGGANNIGMSYALNNGADYVFLLNQDAYLVDTVIDDLIVVHQKNKDYGILSPIHLNGSKTKMDLNFHKFILKNNEFVNSLVLNKLIKTIYQVPFVNAAAWLIPKETLLKIGGFDPLFYHYAEDDNYCHRLKYHNLKIGFVPRTFVIHDREFREKKEVTTLKEHLILKERFYKHHLANINESFEISYSKYSKKNIKGMIFSVLQLKKTVFKQYYLEHKLLISLKGKIKNSRKTYVSVAPNFIEYEK